MSYYSPYSPEMTSFYPTHIHYISAPGPQDDVDVSDLATLASEIFSDAIASSPEATSPQFEPDAYLLSTSDLAQDYMPEPCIAPDTSRYAGVTEAILLATTPDADHWSLSSIDMPCTTMSPSFNLTSFSLCDAYQQLICTPPQPQADIPPLQGFAQLSMHEYAVSPAALQISSHQVVVPVTPKSQFNSIPSTPETQFYSIPSTSSSGSSAWTTDSDPADSDFAPSPRPKRASGHTRKTARASPAAQRAPRTRQRFSPYSSAPSSPYSSESSSRAPAIKYTKRRTQQVDADSPVAEPETEGPRAYMCPLCEHHQTNRHLPDLRRHILTHYPHARKHVCRGVRHAAAPPGAVERFGVVEEDGGEERVGGCYQAFSRHDALLRHLRNTNVVCLYDAAELERRVGRRKAREAAPKAQARPCKDNGKGKAGLRKARQ